MKKHYLALVVVLAMATVASAAYDAGKIQAHGCYAELARDPVAIGGGWEYIVDFYTNGGGSQHYGFWGADTLYENMTNLSTGVDWYGGTGQTILMDWWSYDAAAGYTSLLPPAINDGADNWTATAHPWSNTALKRDFHFSMHSSSAGARWSDIVPLRSCAGALPLLHSLGGSRSRFGREREDGAPKCATGIRSCSDIQYPGYYIISGRRWPDRPVDLMMTARRRTRRA